MALSQVQRAGLIARNKLRQMCRTNLYKLCHVLGYKDVQPHIHQPILDALQKFPGGRDIEIKAGVFRYEPYVPLPLLGRCILWDNTERQTLVLYPRGHLKTTIVTIAHTIQYIINYPNIRVLISVATGDQTYKVMTGLLNQFRYNPDFRALFPEYCPPLEKAADWGSIDKFTVPCRTDFTLKEPTVWVSTVGKTTAGGRGDVLKHTDLVDEQNIKTPGGIKEVHSHFAHTEPLRERYNEAEGFEASVGWSDVEGTPYDFGDLYAELLKRPSWRRVVQPAQENYPTGKILWKQRFPQKELDRIRMEIGDWLFSAQYLMKCVPEGDGLCDPKDVAFVPAEVIGGLMPTLRLHAAIDLAGMENIRDGDYTVLTVGGFDRDGRLYIVECHCGHFKTEEVIELIFDVHRRFPNLVDYKIEKEAHARVLLPFLKREMSKRQRFPILWPINRDTHTSKKHRIRGLRPWFKQGIIRFSSGMPLAVKTELLDEITQFPSESSGVHDDVLDTLADLMQNSDGDGVTVDVVADPPDMSQAQFGMPRPRDRFLGFDDKGVATWLYGPDPSRETFNPTGLF